MPGLSPKPRKMDDSDMQRVEAEYKEAVKEVSHATDTGIAAARTLQTNLTKTGKAKLCTCPKDGAHDPKCLLHGEGKGCNCGCTKRGRERVA